MKPCLFIQLQKIGTFHGSVKFFQGYASPGLRTWLSHSSGCPTCGANMGKRATEPETYINLSLVLGEKHETGIDYRYFCFPPFEDNLGLYLSSADASCLAIIYKELEPSIKPIMHTFRSIFQSLITHRIHVWHIY